MTFDCWGARRSHISPRPGASTTYPPSTGWRGKLWQCNQDKMGGTPSTSTKLLSQLQWRVLTVLGILAGWLLWSLTMTDISKNSMMTTSVGRSMSSKVGSISQEDNQADAVSQEPFLLTSKTATANMTTATVTLTPTAVDSQPTLDSPNGVPWMICNANGFINSMPVINVYDLDGTWSCPMKLCKLAVSRQHVRLDELQCFKNLAGNLDQVW